MTFAVLSVRATSSRRSEVVSSPALRSLLEYSASPLYSQEAATTTPDFDLHSLPEGGERGPRCRRGNRWEAIITLVQALRSEELHARLQAWVSLPRRFHQPHLTLQGSEELCSARPSPHSSEEPRSDPTFNAENPRVLNDHAGCPNPRSKKISGRLSGPRKPHPEGRGSKAHVP
jgi:hypothetical protein